jgi:hypothetical protein
MATVGEKVLIGTRYSVDVHARKRVRMRVPLRAVAVVLYASVALAGRSAAAQDDTEWKASLTPYAWLAGIHGQIGLAGSTADVNLGLSDIFDEIDISVNAAFEMRRGRWVGRLDGTYIALSARQPIGGGVSGDLVFELERGTLQPEIGYRVIVTPWGGIDAMAGGRYWSPRLKVTADAAAGSTEIASGNTSWWDAIGGLRLRADPVPRWHLFAASDVGAGGSKLTWQASGGVGYDVGSCCSIVAAYRHLDVDYDRSGFVNNTYVSGPGFGIDIRF